MQAQEGSRGAPEAGDRPGVATPAERGPEAASVEPARDQAHLHERLENLRTIVPVFAREVAVARREVAALRLENERLLERIRDLHRRGRQRSR
jgi:hypothetical protein